jgi:hypothetical protein
LYADVLVRSVNHVDQKGCFLIRDVGRKRKQQLIVMLELRRQVRLNRCGTWLSATSRPTGTEQRTGYHQDTYEHAEGAPRE